MSSLVLLAVSLFACGGTQDEPEARHVAPVVAPVVAERTPSPPAQPAEPRAEAPDGAPGRTLWVGHSLIRLTEDDDVIYSIPVTLEAMRADAVSRGVLPASTRSDWRVIAANGWSVDGFYTQEDAGHEYRRGLVAITRAPNLYREDLHLGHDFEIGALRGEYVPIGAAHWDTIVSITMASYQGPEVYDATTRALAGYVELARTGRDARGDIGPASPDVKLVHYMGVPPSERLDDELCALTRLYAGYDTRFAPSRTAPVAHAFRTAIRDEGLTMSVLRRANDSVHYSNRGVYLAACVFYALFYGDPELATPPADLRVGSDARRLARAAKNGIALYTRMARDPASEGCP